MSFSTMVTLSVTLDSDTHDDSRTEDRRNFLWCHIVYISKTRN